MSQPAPGDDRIAALLQRILGGPPFALELVPSDSHVCRKASRDQEFLFVKIALDEWDGAALLGGVEAQELAARRGARVPRPIAASANSEFGYAYVVETWAQGCKAKDFLSTAEPAQILAMSQSLGRNVARMHRATLSPAADWRTECERRIDSRVRANEAAGNIPSALLFQIARRCQDLLHHLEPVADGLVHSDLHGDNVIVSGTRVEAIIDFERAQAGDPLLDFVKLDAGLFFEWPESIRAFLEAYREIRHLDDESGSRVYVYQGIEYLSATALLQYYPNERERYRQLIDRWLGNRRCCWNG